MNFEVIIILLIAHWIGDFILQKEEWARGKHNTFIDLISHTIHYGLVIFLFVLFYRMFMFGADLQIYHIIFFWLFNLVAHAIVDSITSRFTHLQRMNEKYYVTKRNLGFFPTIGLDQLIHYIILFTSYKVIFL